MFAETLDYTTFYVRLYKNNDNTNNNGKGILIELQRVDGDSFNYIKYVQAILASAKGEEVDERKASRRRSSLNYIPASILSYHAEKKNRPIEEPNTEYIMHIEELIKKDRSDAVLLGIESLLLLTDQERSHVPLSVAEAVLGVGHPAIKEFVQKCIRCPSSTLCPEDNDFDYASRQCDIMHNTALAVLGNSLQSASDAESPVLHSLVQSDEWMGESGIVDILLSELSHAEDRSHNAYHAARCLNILLDLSQPELKNTLIERGLPNAMKVCQRVGHRRHSLLAQECDTALALLADVDCY